MASAMASISQKSTLMECLSTSATPDCFEMMVGTPVLMASRGDMPNGSDTDGITYTSDIANIRCTSAPLRNPVVEQVSAAGHHEPDVLIVFQDFVRRFYEILRTFLEGNPAEERDYLFRHSPVYVHLAAATEVHRIVDGKHFIRRYAVTVDDRVTGKIAHRYDPVSSLHTHLLKGIDLSIDVLSAAVILRGMHMYHQRLARKPLGRHSGRIGKPVMGMYHIELILLILNSCACERRSFSTISVKSSGST